MNIIVERTTHERNATSVYICLLTRVLWSSEDPHHTHAIQLMATATPHKSKRRAKWKSLVYPMARPCSSLDVTCPRRGVSQRLQHYGSISYADDTLHPNFHWSNNAHTKCQPNSLQSKKTNDKTAGANWLAVPELYSDRMRSECKGNTLYHFHPPLHLRPFCAVAKVTS